MTALNQIQVAFANFSTLEILHPEICDNKLYALAFNQLKRGIDTLKKEYEELGP